jgi:hypothetical protein
MKYTMPRIGAIACLAALLMGSSCIFDTRDAKPPGTQTTACTLETPEKAFLCMTGALQKQQDADYERSLSGDFVFSPTQTDSLDQNFTGIPVYDGWTKEVEMDVLGVLFGDAQSTIVDFGTPAPLINKSTFVRYSVSYSLEVVTVAAPTDTTRYEGVAQIDVRNEGGNWRVTFWNEVETVEGSRTWGYLRGILRIPLVP